MTAPVTPDVGALVARWLIEMSCDDQFAIAEKLAGNIGYSLTPETLGSTDDTSEPTEIAPIRELARPHGYVVVPATALTAAEARADREKARADEAEQTLLANEVVSELCSEEREAALTACRQDTAKLIAEAVAVEREACVEIARQAAEKRKRDVEDWRHIDTPHTASDCWDHAADEAFAIAAAISACTTGGSDHGE